ncbi:hypothetical protein AB6A40_011020 [Gnathostoma spinigerum]|uniref:Uncharacterized protein n=1 Tax=Gnathostoma spinigerum TaxID=75299 RepID=A0ABD6F286_9BILA
MHVQSFQKALDPNIQVRKQKGFMLNSPETGQVQEGVRRFLERHRERMKNLLKSNGDELPTLKTDPIDMQVNSPIESDSMKSSCRIIGSSRYVRDSSRDLRDKSEIIHRVTSCRQRRREHYVERQPVGNDEPKKARMDYHQKMLAKFKDVKAKMAGVGPTLFPSSQDMKTAKEKAKIDNTKVTQDARAWMKARKMDGMYMSDLNTAREKVTDKVESRKKKNAGAKGASSEERRAG